MSPGEGERRLCAEVLGELERVGEVAGELERLAPGLLDGCSRELRMAVAGYLHGLYTGCEAILARLARAFGDLPTGDRWHQALLLRSTAPIEDVRPPILSAATAEVLLELLRFRHFFRVSYGVELVAEKLRDHAQQAPAALARFRSDVTRFLDRLDEAVSHDDDDVLEGPRP